MKVAIVLTDQSFLRTKSMGIFNVSMGLAKGLMKCPEVTELHILGNDECGTAFADCPPHVHVHLLDKPVPRRFARVWWDQFGLSAYVRRLRPDWLILPKGVPPFFPMLGKTKLACYVHDVGWEYYENKSPELRNKAFPLHELMYFRKLSRHALKMADVVLTHSQFNQSRFLSYEPNARIARIGIGFDTPRQAPLDSRNRKDILTYASAFPHKRMDLVVSRISAWLAQRADRDNIRVHLVGSLPPDFALPGEEWIHHQRVPFAELMELVRTQCRMTVYLSDYESYGMPPVESLINGVPCIASDLGGMHENLPAQYLFPNDDEEAFIRVANANYDGTVPFVCPEFPDWDEVCRRCVQALLTH